MRFFSNPRSRPGISKPLAFTFTPLSLIPAILAVSSSSDAPTDADDLICTTTGNIQDCYPRIFNATKTFQVVREGQSIPPGLHVRMDFETGRKEAKLMDPTEADGNQIVMNQGNSLVVVETQPGPSMEIDDGPMAGTYSAGTDVVEKALPQSNDFFAALSAIEAGNATAEHDLDAALEALADVSNDVYYGELMATDYDMIAALLCFGFDEPSAGISPLGYSRSHAAVNTLAGALQNNPKVLQEVMDKWPQLEQHTCAPNRTALGQHIFHGSIAPTTLSTDAKIAAQQGQRVRALASIYGGLLPSPSFRREFLATGGMRHFLEVLIRTEPELAKAQTRLSQIVMDIFLDEDMGAKRGQWPSVAALKGNEAKRVCGGEGDGRTEEGCWDWHVERIAKGAKEGHWSWVLAEALRKERGRGPVKEEL